MFKPSAPRLPRELIPGQSQRMLRSVLSTSSAPAAAVVLVVISIIRRTDARAAAVVAQVGLFSRLYQPHISALRKRSSSALAVLAVRLKALQP